MHLAAVAASVLVLHSGVVSPGDPVTVSVVGALAKAPLHAYLRDSFGRRHLLAAMPRGRRKIAVRFPQFPVDYYTLVSGRGTLAVRALPPAGFGPAGARGCAPPSPSLGTDTFGTSAGAYLWALAFGSLDGVVGKEKKIVFRMTSAVPRVFYSVAPDGRRVPPNWVEPHTSSNWNRPGFEWGAGFTFDVPGCWQIHAGAWPAQGDIWLVVNS